MLIVNLQFHLVEESVSFDLDPQQLLKRFSAWFQPIHE
jgi:hypothetical protein